MDRKDDVLARELIKQFGGEEEFARAMYNAFCMCKPGSRQQIKLAVAMIHMTVGVPKEL